MHGLPLLLIGMLLFFDGSATPPSEPSGTSAAVGVGMAMPHLFDGHRLYFYGIPDFDQVPDDMTPIDSVVFAQGQQHVEITTAPPWFWPEVMKLDYDLLFLRAKTLSKNWVEVVVNRETGRTGWIDRQAVRFVDWPQFLLDVHSIEILDPAANPIRIKPLDHASILAESPPIPLKVLAVQGSWLQILTDGVADRIAPTGWIRWRNGDELLISYSPLS